MMAQAMANRGDKLDRTKEIIKTSVIGIAANIALASLKLGVGLRSGSTSITLDAVNNLTDALAPLITIIGVKMSAKDPNRRHPYGYGRIECLSTMAIGMIISCTGLFSIVESIKKVVHPAVPNYSALALVIIGVTVAARMILGLYTIKTGKKIESESLVASGKDALNDSFISISTIVVAVVFILTGLNVEAFLGLVFSILILKAGLETLDVTVSKILGERVPVKLSKAVKESIKTFPEVDGVYCLVIHDYGRDRLLGSAHIEVPESLTALYLDSLERNIAQKVLQDTGVNLSGITVYATNGRSQEAASDKNKVKSVLSEYKDVLQMHGFYKDKVDMVVKFDIVVDFDAQNKKALRDEIAQRVKKLFPEYDVSITVDYDYSE